MPNSSSHGPKIDFILKSLDPSIIHKWLERIKRGFLHTTILYLFGNSFNNGAFPIMTGSDIIKLISAQSLDHWKPSPGSLYPILKEMQEDKVIKRCERGDKKAKAYQITDVGVSLLHLVKESSLIFARSESIIGPDMPKQKQEELFLHQYGDRSIKELIAIQKNYLQLANFVGDLIEKNDKNRNTQKQ